MSNWTRKPRHRRLQVREPEGGARNPLGRGPGASCPQRVIGVRFRELMSAPASTQVSQEGGRIRRYSRISDGDGRRWRVVLLPTGETVYSAFFHRGLKPPKIRYFKEAETPHIELPERLR